MEQRFTFIKTNEVKEDFDSEERVEVEVVMETCLTTYLWSQILHQEARIPI